MDRISNFIYNVYVNTEAQREPTVKAKILVYLSEV